MLRICIPIEDDPIFELHQFAEHLVCEIWCRPDSGDGIDRIHEKYRTLITYDWLKKEITDIHTLCSKLSAFSLLRIKFAFLTNNDIEALCNGKRPIYFDQLPEVVETRMKPLFVKFYEDLLDRVKVGGDKMEYYNLLYKANRYKYCTCCGYMPFDTGQLERREAYDHYLPKSKYPFASVNFKNLVPLCYKCNSDRKKDQDPIKNERKAFYPFRNDAIIVDITTALGDGFIRSLYETVVNDIEEGDLDPAKIEDITISLASEEQEQVNTWDDLFQIKDRFSERTGQFSFSHLGKMKRRYNDRKRIDNTWNFAQTLDYYVTDYENDRFLDEKFLKIPFMKAIKGCESLMNIYTK